LEEIEDAGEEDSKSSSINQTSSLSVRLSLMTIIEQEGYSTTSLPSFSALVFEV